MVTFREHHKYMTHNLQYTNFPLAIYAKPNYSTPLSYNKAWESEQNCSLIIYRIDCNPLKWRLINSYFRKLEILYSSSFLRDIEGEA